MSDIKEFRLPDVGEGLTEAEIVSWKVKPGDSVKINDVIVEIETAKSLVELPVPFEGVVSGLLVPEGQTVPVGTPIIAVEVAGASSSGAAAAPSASVGEGAGGEGVGGEGVGGEGVGGGGEDLIPTPPADGATPKEKREAVLVGYGVRPGAATRRARKGAPPPAAVHGLNQSFATAPLAEPAGEAAVPAGEAAARAGEVAAPAASAAVDVAPAAPPVPAPVDGGAGAAVALAKPPVRKLAKDLGVDLRAIIPSGPGGSVTREDVYAAQSPVAEAEPVAASAGAAARAAVLWGGGEREERVPIRSVRKATAQAVVASAFTAPHVSEFLTVDVTRTTKLVDRLRESREFTEVRLSPMAVLARAVCIAAQRTPEVNSSWDEAAQEIVLKRYVNLGIAAATPRGLVVPNVKDAHALSLRDLAVAINTLASTARSGRTPPADMLGGTLSITNVGVFGVDTGTPILPPGEALIVAFGAVRRQPWVHKGRVRPRWVTTLGVSFDHRLVDGEQGSRFLADVGAILEDPAQAIVWG